MFASWIPIAASVIGDVFSANRQNATNEQTMQMQLQNEQWQEHMSDTSMQRRVADYKAAGLNPMLAAGGPGAQGGSTVMGSLQNPGQAFGNLGSQVTNAMQLKSQQASIDLMNTQARQADSQAGVNLFQVREKMPAEVQKIQADTGVSVMQASQIAANLKYIDAQIKNVDADTAIKNITAMLQGMNADVLRGSVKALTQINLDAAKAADYGLPLMERGSDYYSSIIGKATFAAQQLLHPIQSGADLYRTIDPQGGNTYNFNR